MKPLLLAFLLLAPLPVHALPVVEDEFWVMTYCGLSPTGSVVACGGVAPLNFRVQVAHPHTVAWQVYELSDAQLDALHLPRPEIVLFDYVTFGGNSLFSNDREFWDGVPLPFVALPAPQVAWVPELGVDQGPIAHTPEPLSMALWGATLVGVGLIARRRR